MCGLCNKVVHWTLVGGFKSLDDLLDGYFLGGRLTLAQQLLTLNLEILDGLSADIKSLTDVRGDTGYLLGDVRYSTLVENGAIFESLLNDTLYLL